MDDTLSNREVLLQQLQQLKRELAKKERKLMKMEKVAQAKKRASVLNPERKCLSISEETNDDLRQNVSDTSTNSSVNDVLSDSDMLSSAKKCDCNKDGCNSVPQRSCSNTCEYQKECASSVKTDHLRKSSVMSHESTVANNYDISSSSMSSEENKESVKDDAEKAPETASGMDGNGLPLYPDCSSEEVSHSKLSKEGSSVSDKKMMNNNSCSELCINTRADSPSQVFCTRPYTFMSNDHIQYPSLSMNPSVNAQNLNTAKQSQPLKSDCSFDDHITTQLGTFKDKNICMREQFPEKSEKSKSSEDTLEMKLEQNNLTESEHLITLVPNIDTDHSECPENMSKFVGTPQKHKVTDLSNSFSKETSKSAEHVDDKASTSGKDLKNTKMNCKVDMNEADKMQQSTADVSNHSSKASRSEDFPLPRSFRRSQRLSKQNVVACGKKYNVQSKPTFGIRSLFEWFSQKCKSNDVTDFELPPEEFGLLMEIKVKNSNQDAWPPSPSESFEMLTPEEFIPDSEENKNPYCYSPNKLLSSLVVTDSKCSIEGFHAASEYFSDSLRTMLVNNGSPSKISEKDENNDHPSITASETKELILRSEFSGVNSTQDLNEFIPCTPNEMSSFEKSPEKPVVFDNCESQSPLKSKHSEQHVVLETEGFDLDLDDVEKSQVEQPVYDASLAVRKHTDSDVTSCTTTDIKNSNSADVSLPYTVLSNRNCTPQKRNMGEDMEHIDLFDSWSPLNTCEFSSHSVNKAADGTVNIVSSKARCTQRKLFNSDEYMDTDVFMPDKMLNTVTNEFLPDVKNSDLPLHNNLVDGPETCDSAIRANADNYRNLSFLCCLETEKKKPVKGIHIFSVNDEILIAIQCDSVIEIWKKCLRKEWTKLGIYNTENMTSIEKLCALTSGESVIFVVLVCTNGRQSMRFLSMDVNLHVIQVMENNSFEQYSNKMKIKLLLCGLGGLAFATADGIECCFVDIHFIEVSGSEPFLTSQRLSSVSDSLLGLSSVENAPKALMGWSLECLYIWNYVSGSLVTTVNLMPKPLNLYGKCLWATSEEGLLFLLLVSADKNSLDSCHLVAVNPVTGLWDTIQYFRHSSHEEHRTSNKFIDGTVLERHVALTCCQNSYLLDLYTGSKIASLTGCNVTSVMCSHGILVVGLQSGCANLYSFH